MTHKPLLVLFLSLLALFMLVAAPRQWPAAAGDPLPKPEDIKCQGRAADTVVVSWKDTASDEDEYRVERRIDGGSWTEVEVMTPNGEGKYSAYEETGVDTSSPNREYRVRSYRNSDTTFSPYSDICNNRRIATTDNYRIFYGLLGQDQCPKIGTREVCLTDTSADGENVFVTLQKTALEGSLDAFTRLGFTEDAGTPPSGLDKIPINVVWCDGGGCAGGGGLGLSPFLMEKSFDLDTRAGDPIAWLVALHEAFHFQQYKYPGLNDPASKWAYEGQARMIQDHICIGGDRSTAECFDDIDTGYAGYVGQINGYLGNPNRPINETSYDAALFWKYLAEKYGTSSPGDDVEAGINIVIKFWEQANANPGNHGIYAVNQALDELGHSETFRDVWKDFAVANYAKDLSGPGVPGKYQYDDVSQPGGSYNAPSLALDENLIVDEQIIDTDETVRQWGAQYYEVRPDADVPFIQIEFTQDTGHMLYYTVLGVKSNDLVYEHNVEARDLEHTLVNNDYDRVVVVVAALENMANYRYAFNGTQPTLQIVTPTTFNMARVGDPSAPDKFLTKIDVLDGSGVPMSGVDLNNFSFRIGSEDVPASNILTSATVQGQHWFVIRAVPQASAISYDFEVSYSGGSLSDTEVAAISYNPRDEADSMITLDRSGSMGSNDKLQSAQDAARLYVDSWHEGDMLGVVTFSDSAVVDLGLTPWTDSPSGGSRQDAFDAIDAATAFGGTAIGDALRASWDELIADGETDHDWAIVLLSDGLETAGDEAFDDLINELRDTTDKRPTVHAIAVGPDADRLRMQRVANVTGGTYQAVSVPTGASLVPQDLQLDLDARYRMIATEILGLQQNFTFVGPKNDGDRYTDVVDIPIEENADELILSLSYEERSQLALNLPVLRDPNGNSVPIFQDDGRHFVWRVPSPQQGTWTLTLSVLIIEVNGADDGAGAAPDAVESFPVAYLVQSSLRSDVTMEVYLNAPVEDRTPGVPVGIVASLTDTGPLTGANVVATVENPNAFSYVVTLHDDGLHDDGEADDGIYANTFMQTGVPGSYNVTVNAAGTSALSGPFTRQALRSFYIHSEGDRDQDGLPDEWEDRYGTDPDVPDAGDDPDNDGSNNGEEHERGTDPHDPDTDNGGEADGTDPDPLDPSDDRELPQIWGVAYGGVDKVNVKYTTGPWAFVGFFRGPSEDGPFTYMEQTTTPTGVYTDTNVTNGTQYCYRVAAIGTNFARTILSPPTCATPNVDPLPPYGWVLINDGAPSTPTRDVTLTLWASDDIDPHLEEEEEFLPPDDSASGVSEMMVSNYPDFRDASWEPYSESKAWTLAQSSGLATVYVKYRDAYGNESDVATATIEVAPGRLLLPFVAYQ